eukprot:1157870-Pelagomonas_calceolata.AAC.13
MAARRGGVSSGAGHGQLAAAAAGRACQKAGIPLPVLRPAEQHAHACASASTRDPFSKDACKHGLQFAWLLA